MTVSAVPQDSMSYNGYEVNIFKCTCVVNYFNIHTYHLRFIPEGVAEIAQL
jgi:hypothetical protein